MAVFISSNDIEGFLKEPAKQGKRELPVFKALMKEKGAPLSIVEDTDVSDNKAEVHMHTADLWYCLEGEATFTVGGALVDGTPRKLSDGTLDETEWRSVRIEGGTDIVVKKGDWLYIPAGEPHLHRADGTARLLIAKIPS